MIEPLPSCPKMIRLSTSHYNSTVHVHWSRYSNDRIAMWFSDVRDDAPVLTATTNLPNLYLADGYTFIKSYSENEGALQCMVDRKLVEHVADVPTGYTVSHVCRWLVRFR